MNDIFVIPGMEPKSDSDMGLRRYLAGENKLASRSTFHRIIVVENLTPDALRDFESASRASPGAFTVLLRTEPLIVLPSNFKKSNTQRFNLIITLGGDPAADSTVFPWPQVWRRKLLARPDFPRCNRIVLVNANKLSLIRGENYSLRREVAAQIESVQLYGEGWHSSYSHRALKVLGELRIALSSRQKIAWGGLNRFFSLFPRSQPPVPDKFETMRRFKYALVIENSNEYMSEKLFDAFFSGCIPVYVGPNPKKYNIPEDLYVYSERNLSSIKRAMELAHEMDYQEWKTRLVEFLDNPITRAAWGVEETFASIVGLIESSYMNWVSSSQNTR